MISLCSKMRAVILLISSLAAVSAGPTGSQRIVGGTETTIEQYPEVASLLFSNTEPLFNFACAGIILNNRAILTAAHCVVGDPVIRWRISIGSTFATGGGSGSSHFPNRIILHPGFTSRLDNDVAIMHSSTAFVYSSVVRPAGIAGPNYFLADNQPVWAIGWGADRIAGPSTGILRHVQIYTVNQEICRQRYAAIGRAVTDNMLCAGVLDVGGRDQCNGDAGGPLYHNGNVVGVCSWGERCGLPQFPGVNARVSRFTAWIQASA